MGKLCQLLEISRSGYYAWLRGGKSARKTANQALLRELVRLHEKYPALGLDSLYHMLKPAFHCSRGRVHRLMKAAGIHSQRKRAYKATTNSRHNCPIAPNLLQRQFTFSRPNQAWVGDITYIPTGEGWLYFAIVKDLCTTLFGWFSAFISKNFLPLIIGSFRFVQVDRPERNEAGNGSLRPGA